jgi:hypothetical protein
MKRFPAGYIVSAAYRIEGAAVIGAGITALKGGANENFGWKQSNPEYPSVYWLDLAKHQLRKGRGKDK